MLANNPQLDLEDWAAIDWLVKISRKIAANASLLIFRIFRHLDCTCSS